MRYSSKAAFIEDIETSWNQLQSLITDLDEKSQTQEYVCAKWSIKDMLAHLSEWHALALGWYATGLKGRKPEMPAAGYKWSEIRALNHEFYLKNKDLSLVAAKSGVRKSHNRILSLIKGLSEAELLEPGHFAWTTKYPLTTYFHANTSGHYRWAIRHIKKWRRGIRRAGKR